MTHDDKVRAAFEHRLNISGDRLFTSSALRLYRDGWEDALSTANAGTVADNCPYCGGVKGHWEGCKAPVCTTGADKAQPVEKKPFGYFHELLDHEGKGQRIWLGCADKSVTEKAHVEGETSKEIVTLYAAPVPKPVETGAREDVRDRKAAFDAWFEKRGVWPMLNYEEVFFAGMDAALQSELKDATKGEGL